MEDEKKHFLTEIPAIFSKKRFDSSARVSALTKPSEELQTSNTVSTASESASNGHFSVVVAEIRGYLFACRIDSRAEELVIPDTIVAFLKHKSVFIPMLSQPRTLKTVDKCLVQSPENIQLSAVLTTSAGKSLLRNLHMHNMPDDDATVPDGAICAGGNCFWKLFLTCNGLNFADIIAMHMTLLSLFATATWTLTSALENSESLIHNFFESKATMKSMLLK